MEKKFIVFNIDEQQYCVDINNVKEIILYQNTIELPNTPDFVEGVINLRGDVVSVLSLAKRIGKISTVPKEEQKIILTSNNGINTGFLVDDVNEMIVANENEILNAPELVQTNYTNYISGVINKETYIYLIVDFNKILNHNEMIEIEEMLESR